MSTSAATTYYVIRFKGFNTGSPQYAAKPRPYHALPGLGGGTSLRAEARQYATVSDALHAINENGAQRNAGHIKEYGSLRAEIIKVTEVPGTSTLTVTNTRVVDLSKPVVLYEPEEGVYVTASGFGSKFLADAHVFNDGSDALDRLMYLTSTFGNLYERVQTHLVNVETITTEPTITEEVLA